VSISLSQQAYLQIRDKIVRLQLAPGDVIREDVLQAELGIGRTPIREALQRLARDQFVTELSMLYETRAILEPYAMRLAAVRGKQEHWDAMAAALESSRRPNVSNSDLMRIDRRCHEIVWEAANNRFLTDTLDMMYAQSDRLWHLYIADVEDMRHALEEHTEMYQALSVGDGDLAAKLAEAHVRAFDEEMSLAVRKNLGSPLN